ncbi:MAG: arylsulfatase [Halobacteriales archaeon]
MVDTDPPYPSKVGVDVPDDWDPPNVVFVIADDLGRSDIGCYGGDLIPTPHMDRLAAEGMRFTDCYGGHPVCAPSRDALMTGRHTGHTTLRDNMGDVGGMRTVDERSLQKRVGLADDDTTIAEVLSEAGYATGAAGKWGLGEPGTDATPTRKGFDTWFGYLNQRRAHTYYPPHLWEDETRIEYPGNTTGTGDAPGEGNAADDGPYSHDLIEDFAIEFIEERATAGERFFAYLPFTLPHSELVVPEYEPFVEDDWSDAEKAYASMVSRFDQAVGRVLEALEEAGVDGETAVFVTVDHGGDDHPAEPFSSTDPLTGYKRDLYEGGIRVPMLARWPGSIPAGEVCEAPVYFADVFPTLAEMAGRPQPSIPGDVDGISILPTLLGESQDGLRNRYLYWEDPGDGLGQAARYGDWKAVRPDRGSETELYDLAADEREDHDVSEDHPGIVARFERFFADAHEESPHWPTW